PTAPPRRARRWPPPPRPPPPRPPPPRPRWLKASSVSTSAMRLAARTTVNIRFMTCSFSGRFVRWNPNCAGRSLALDPRDLDRRQVPRRFAVDREIHRLPDERVVVDRRHDVRRRHFTAVHEGR